MDMACVKEIYDKLMDDESREIFTNRFMFLHTGDWNYLLRNGQNYYKSVEEYLIESILNGVRAYRGGKELVVYGAGNVGIRVLKALGNRISYFCDSDASKQHREVFGWKWVLSPEELASKKDDVVVVIASCDYYYDVAQWLAEHSIEMIDCQIPEKKRHTGSGLTEFVQYFDDRIIDYRDEEVFVDAGCLDYGTSLQFLKSCRSAKKIYAFEPDLMLYYGCCQKAAAYKGFKEYELFNKGVYDEETTLTFDAVLPGSGHIVEGGAQESPEFVSVETCTIDGITKCEATFIKMDIEGAELKALQGAAQTIAANRPKLAISVYHKPEDIVELPGYILSIQPDYNLYLRQYSQNANETVLYAI